MRFAMSIDPDEEFWKRKRGVNFKQVQDYIEKQDAIDKDNYPGKMGSHEIKIESAINQKTNNLLNRIKGLFSGSRS